MKKQLIFMVLLFAVMFTGCSKDDEPVLDREKFIGSYSGTQSVAIKVDGVTVSTETEATTERIDAGLDANQVLFGKNTDEEIKATVSGSSLTIAKQTKAINYEGELISAEITGHGTMSSNKVLTLTYNIDFKDGSLIVITATLNKN